MRRMQWSKEQLELAEKYHRKLEKIPRGERRYKCFACHIAFPHETTPTDGKKAPECPQCHTKDITQMCPLDHNDCYHEIFQFSEMCPLCDQPVCPACGSHDVTVISRVTGYLQDLAGWNNAKQQEFRDRNRYNIK